MPQARTLTDREFRQLLDRTQFFRHAQRNQMLLYMTHLAGFRVGELAELKMTDLVDSQGLVQEQVVLQPEQTKGSRHRTVFLNQKLRDHLKLWIDKEPKQGWLFHSQKREKFTANTLQQTLTLIYERAGYKGCTSHTGRRTFLTNLASKGVSIRVLQELAGHRHIATTQRYIDVNDGMKREAINKL